HGWREFRPSSTPAVARVELGCERTHRGLEDRRSRDLTRGRSLRVSAQVLQNFRRGSLELRASGLPGLGDGRKKRSEARPTVAVVRRKVGSAVKRLAVGGQKKRERPAAAPGQRLDGSYVDIIDIGAFFPVDL